MPTDVRALEDAVGVRLVVADRTDPEDVGFVQWRVAFYLAGDLNNFLLLLDDFFVYKAKAIAREQPFQVQIFPHTGVEVTVLDDFSYEHVELMEQTATPPLKTVDRQNPAPPCNGRLTLHVGPHLFMYERIKLNTKRRERGRVQLEIGAGFCRSTVPMMKNGETNSEYL